MQPDPSPSSPDASGGLGVLARVFFKLGVIGFGGPAAHIAMMEDEIVERRGWLSRQHFLDLIGATNLVPGPNSTEMTMHVGYERGRWPGLFVAGGAFIFPAALSTGLLAWLYVRYGEVPAVAPFLAGIKPAVMAVILGALWRLGKKAVKSWTLAVLGLAVGAALALGLGELWALLAGGIVGMGVLGIWQGRAEERKSGGGFLLPVVPQDSVAVAVGATGAAAGVSLWALGLFFLKVGAVLYGSGYVLIAFLEGGLVEDYGWLTEQQLLDAIAIGQFTPGPVLTTATFIGYVLGGVPGAAVATLGIFLPAFVFVGILNPVVPRLRDSRWTAAFLDAVNVSAVALMAVVTLKLGADVLVSPGAWVIFAVAAVLALRFKVNAAWIVLGGALAGWVLT
ncbi:MAG: chromate efflux transporter [Bacteroidota bacterium]